MMTSTLTMNPRAKAVLKTPQSMRCRDCRWFTDFAKRLECGAFTAALPGHFINSVFRLGKSFPAQDVTRLISKCELPKSRTNAFPKREGLTTE